MYRAIYMISDHDCSVDFNKVKAIEPCKVNPDDRLLYFDNKDYFVHLSDIVMIIDSKGNQHTENILALLEGLR